MHDLLPVPPPLGWRARARSAARPSTAAGLARRPRQRGRGGSARGRRRRCGVGVAHAAAFRVAHPAGGCGRRLVDPGVGPQRRRRSWCKRQARSLSPGVYRVPADARVIDVIDAAGGLAPGADADRLALAAKVSDGERVYVPRVGEALPSAPAGAAEPRRACRPQHRVERDLDALPGVGPATAKAIVTYRESHGPFTSVEQLLEVRGIGPAKLDQLADLVRV